MSRVLWIGDAGCHTGFGRVTHQIAERLVQIGHDIHVLAVNYDGDMFPGVLDPSKPTPLKLYRPTKLIGSDTFGTSRFVELLAEIMPDVVLIMHDPYTVSRLLFRNKKDDNLITARFRPLIAYMPIDGTNYPPTNQKMIDAIDSLDPISGEPKPSMTRVAMSTFGQTQMPGSELIYHGVDTELFRPVSESSPMTTTSGLAIKTNGDAKAAFGYPRDSFLVLRIDRNSARKDFAATWKALVPVMERHRDVIVHLHCKGQGDELELPELFARDPATANRFYLPGQHNTKIGWPEQDLAVLYNAADLFVSTSHGEGFGLTLGEAAACGVPVVAQNVSSIPEVVGPGGVFVEPVGLITTFAGQDQWLPDANEFTNVIEYLYSSRRRRRELGEAGRAHVVANFSWDRAAAQFSDLIDGLTRQGGSPTGGNDVAS